jgi:cellulose synthase/poly-beta-1,6-N-acetylglucosamine synthase-like glycosyltransferase
VTAIIAILLAPFALLTAFFTLEVLLGLRRDGGGPTGAGPASAVVVMPAHDEAEVIGASVRALLDGLPDNVRVIVVADNCTDDTAELARAAGAEVLERNDPARRGKGFALTFAADHLRGRQPDLFVVLDADCRMDPASIRALVDAAAEGRPAQAINLLRPDRSAPPLVQISTFAFMLKNLVRQRGLQLLSGRVHLTGTGMAMPFALFRGSRQVQSSIVEDLAMGLELADAGHAPTLVQNSTVWSRSSTQKGTLTQRRRWEGGFLATAIRQGPREIGRGLRHASLSAVFAGLDLMVPPLALFAFLNAAVVTVALLLTVALGASWWPVVVQLGLLAAALAAIALAWVREGRSYISLGVLARLPIYVLWKLPMYLKFARRGAPGEWLRTGR